ncbi:MULTISPECIES: hypothetical protein [unclassified Sphingomonas]|uniref:hypothetical protein n=1 Tax=unclassified Sphingomonas TaxID=196159 RepID=UPI0009279C9E|nr:MULTISPECIES: hypothetical protein [unclassified Sphingomonas]MBN8849234.1 hypothetical protein [Sphingomonas sp.]OJV29220.1 MAG: hypothetical protein BGO24_03440 [Sphingomonas sp. 67-36]
MTRLRIAPVALVAALALTACVGGPAVPTPIAPISTKQLRIYGVRAYLQSRGLLVMGQVRRPPLDLGPLWGHLHVTASFRDGRPPLVVDTRWGTISPRGVRSALFAAVLRTQDPGQIELVRVEYRPVSDDRHA